MQIEIKQQLNKMTDSYMELRNSLKVSVKIDHEEVTNIVIRDLIAKRSSKTNKIKDSFDAVLRYYLTEDEFETYVINGKEI